MPAETRVAATPRPRRGDARGDASRRRRGRDIPWRPCSIVFAASDRRPSRRRDASPNAGTSPSRSRRRTTRAASDRRSAIWKTWRRLRSSSCTWAATRPCLPETARRFLDDEWWRTRTACRRGARTGRCSTRICATRSFYKDSSPLISCGRRRTRSSAREPTAGSGCLDFWHDVQPRLKAPCSLVTAQVVLAAANLRWVAPGVEAYVAARGASVETTPVAAPPDVPVALDDDWRVTPRGNLRDARVIRASARSSRTPVGASSRAGG